MNQTELKTRLAAWTWAATTLGVDAGTERVRGLVEATMRVPAQILKASIEEAMFVEPSNFLPNPGAVLAASKELTKRGALRRPQLAAPRNREAEDRRLRQELNPQGWDHARWAAFAERLATDPAYAARVEQARADRHAWATEQAALEIQSRQVTHSFRIDVRRQLNLEAFDVYPRPDPLADGWVRARDFDPIAMLTKSVGA